MEKFAIPAVGAIIENEIDGEKYILIQKRVKSGETVERGLVEIPAGKIREYENIYDALKREIKEETNLDIVSIKGKNNANIEINGYEVINVEPFSVAQNLVGGYSLIVLIFICRAEGEIHDNALENENVQWCKVENIRNQIINKPESFYPMHILTLKKYLGL